MATIHFHYIEKAAGHSVKNLHSQKKVVENSYAVGGESHAGKAKETLNPNTYAK